MIRSSFNPATGPNEVDRTTFLSTEGVYASPGSSVPLFVNIAGQPFARNPDNDGSLSSLNPDNIPGDARFVRLAGVLTLELTS